MVTNTDVLLTSLWIGVAFYPFLRKRRINYSSGEALLRVALANRQFATYVMRELVTGDYSPAKASIDLQSVYARGEDILQALADYADD
jgi:hypothetical protein